MSPGARAQKTRERIIAVGLTFSAYGAIFFFLTRPSPIPPFSNFDNGSDIAVTLVGHGASSAGKVQTSDPLEALAQEFSQESSSDAAAPVESQTRTSLSELFGDTTKSSHSPSGGAASPRSGSVVRTGLVGDPGAQISGGRRNVAVGPDGQIPPCWRQLEQRVPVRISIILDNQGGLIGPPEILRARNARSDAAQRAAETVAMRAMAGCAPFSLAAVAGRYRSFELDFSKDRNWIQSTGLVDLR